MGPSFFLLTDQPEQIFIRSGEEEEDNTDCKQEAKDEEEQKVAFDHRLQSYDCRNNKRAVLPDNLECIIQPVHFADERPLSIDQ